MRKFLSAFFKKVSEILEKSDSQKDVFEKEETNTTSLLNKKSLETSREEEQRAPIEEHQSIVNELSPPKVKEKQEKSIKKTTKTEIIPYPDNPIRDIIDLMEFPFLALSKDRINPIVYESADKTQKVVISGHRGHFLASIYDWDIILVVAGKIQEILNNSEIPSHNVIIPRHELLKALHKKRGKKQQKDLEKSLARLQLTGIETTVNNKDYRHKAGFGFIDSWGYLERKNDREIRNVKITLSPWLYELCCAKGSLLKSNSKYFELTSGLKRFLYRTARKHAGINRDGWEFSLEKLYEKSGSENDFRKFKARLKAAVLDHDIPEYLLKWIDRNGKISVEFKKISLIEEIDRIVEKHEENKEKMIEFSKADNLP